MRSLGRQFHYLIAGARPLASFTEDGREPLDASLEPARPWMAAAEPQRASMLSAEAADDTRNERDLVRQRDCVVFGGIDVGRKGSPKHEAAVWPGQRRALWKVSFNRAGC